MLILPARLRELNHSQNRIGIGCEPFTCVNVMVQNHIAVARIMHFSILVLS
jgi:hypothetical protein